MEKQYLDYNGLANVAGYVNTRLKTVTTMPVSADNGAVRLYVGTSGSTYEQGHIYQYNSENTEWVDITPIGSGGEYRLLTGTLLANAWSNNTQTVTIQGINSTTNGVIGLLDSATSTQIESAKSSEINVTTIGTNSVSFVCKNVPTIDIPFGVLVGGGGGSSTNGVQIPSIVGDKFFYNGIAQAPVITGLDTVHCTVTGTTSATNIGQYTITISLSEGLSWSDGTTADITFTYDIIPIGVKYTPTDDIQTWLACAEIWDKTSYTTLADVLADSDTLEALLANGNAVDYLVRSTTWISSICSDEDAMTAIGDSDVCADKLLENYEWLTAICGSTYFEEILNVKVPTMTSDTTPVGVGTVSESSYATSDRMGWRAFDGIKNASTYWQSVGSSSNETDWVEFTFPSAVSINRLDISAYKDSSCSNTQYFKLIAFNDNFVSDSHIIMDETSAIISTDLTEVSFNFANSDKYTSYRLYQWYDTKYYGTDLYYSLIHEVQMYGRASSSQSVDMPYEASALSQLRDVDIVGEPKEGEILRYSKLKSKWTNRESEKPAPPIYGVSWDGTSSPSWTRTDDAALFTDPVPQMSNGSGGWTQGSSPFDTIAPWSGMVKSERAGGTMVAIPKFYYKLTKTGSAMSIKIVSGEYKNWALDNGYSISPIHMDREDGRGERDIAFIGRYTCASDYKSKTGVASISTHRSTFRTNIHNLGSNIWQFDYTAYWTICLLYLVEYASWDTQSKIGYGCCKTSGTTVNSGITDSMTYHTGTTETSRNSYGFVQYRNFENLWANEFAWIDGVRFSGTNMYAYKNPSEFSDDVGGTYVGVKPYSSNGNPYITSFLVSDAIGYTWFVHPSSTMNGNYNTYVCDCYKTYQSSGNTLSYGGNGQTTWYGLFSFDNRMVDSTANSYSRIMELP